MLICAKVLGSRSVGINQLTKTNMPLFLHIRLNKGSVHTATAQQLR